MYFAFSPRKTVTYDLHCVEDGLFIQFAVCILGEGGASVLQYVDILAYVDIVVKGYTIREKKYIVVAVDVDTYSKNIINSSMKKKSGSLTHPCLAFPMDPISCLDLYSKFRIE